MGFRKCLKNTFYIGSAIAVGAYWYKAKQRRRSEVLGNYSPLIDKINVTVDGVLSEQYAFSWDDEERCIYARVLKFGSLGQLIDQKFLEFEHYDDKILVAESNDDSGDLKAFSIYTRNEFGMITSVIHRLLGGKERRDDLFMNGSELSMICTGEDQTFFKWEEGNIVSISRGENERLKMTYYKNIENHLFPDINLLIKGLSCEMPLTYLMGTRSRNYVRTIVKNGPQFHEQTFLSYLLDHYDRPIQILMETTTVSEEKATNSSKEFDITYKKI